ncbi:MAG: fasciclin domain-containing protein [Chitinophagaceae bacterium]|nr:MAG: fasciclin domain-containing protein [Chitinophagaceae bacterium]
MKLNKLFLSASIVLLAAVTVVSCDKRDNNVAYAPGISANVATVAENNGLTIFAGAMRRAGMDSTFAYLGQYTIFAPTDSAFAAAGISASAIASLPVETVRVLLRNHILSGRTTLMSFLPGPNAAYTNLNRDTLFVTGVGTPPTAFYINGRKVTQTDIAANNGVIHKIAGVLAPAGGNFMTTIGAATNLTFFAAAINRANLANTFNTVGNRWTVFAPTNAAFQAAGFADIAAINAADPTTLANILRYHALPAASLVSSNRIAFSSDLAARYGGTSINTVQGTPVLIGAGGTTVKGTSNATAATITVSDILYRSGVLHVIDKVLMP